MQQQQQQGRRRIKHKHHRLEESTTRERKSLVVKRRGIGHLVTRMMWSRLNREDKVESEERERDEEEARGRKYVSKKQTKSGENKRIKNRIELCMGMGV